MAKECEGRPRFFFKKFIEQQDSQNDMQMGLDIFPDSPQGVHKMTFHRIGRKV